MKYNKKLLNNALLSLGLLVLYSLAICFFDVEAIGPNGTEVGFSHINAAFASLVPYNATLDKITDVFMLIAILTALAFAVVGLVQLVKRKSLFKVDNAIIGLGVVYLVVIVLYVLFDKVAISYRPVLVPGEEELETSFPSSHVLVIATILTTAKFAIDKVFPEKTTLRKIVAIVVPVIVLLTVVLRAFAGVHWISDILAGALFAIVISNFYYLANYDEH
ncbi:phosphatase PAP2 family protein [Butyrivibrio proteoclasticus]|uniref:phosphatase PAP2 family protein n=1 Tax=Butyrivibrio proteoclasticus TaxID=43305 RepID=UPI00047C40F6|nr:phosphatase PAP2 family protein [Butyrivibrio proteoclasticus]